MKRLERRYLVFDVVVGQLGEHFASKSIDDGLARLSARVARVLRLNAHDCLQHSVRRVRLVSTMVRRRHEPSAQRSFTSDAARCTPHIDAFTPQMRCRDCVSSCGFSLMPVVYQVVGFGRGVGRHMDCRRRSLSQSVEGGNSGDQQE